MHTIAFGSFGSKMSQTNKRMNKLTPSKVIDSHVFHFANTGNMEFTCAVIFFRYSTNRRDN